MQTIVVTGAAGFIGSYLVAELQQDMYRIIAVDDFSAIRKEKNLLNKSIFQKIDRKDFIEWLGVNHREVDVMLHIGARTDTTEQNIAVLDELNYSYSKALWELCTTHRIPMIYASSAATYGNGEFGYKDDHQTIPQLKPMNPYGQSKQDFDCWVLKQTQTPPFWAGLKFFNVYGPNEYHKGRMASVVFHTFNQIQEKGEMRLFRSHKAEIKDGYQSRDFVYVKDVAKVILFLMETQAESAIYNLGSGTANPFIDLARFTFEAMEKEVNISFIDTPEDIRDTYQYYTCASMDKLLQAGYRGGFYSLKEGVHDYVKNYLLTKQYA